MDNSGFYNWNHWAHRLSGDSSAGESDPLPDMQKEPPSREPAMSALRHEFQSSSITQAQRSGVMRQPSHKKRFVLLTLLFLIVGFATFDLSRPPQNQASAKAYLWLVHQYQHYGRPLSRRYIRCRFTPTCSEYSIQAVRKYGLLDGIGLTARRILSCRSGVPFGTYDPVR